MKTKHENCIVVNDDKFVITTFYVKIDDKGNVRRLLPLNLVLVEPDGRTWSQNHYTLVNHNIQVSWLDYYQQSKWKCLTFTYKRVKLLEINAVPKLQVVVDALNRFKNISDKELEALYEKGLNQEKSDLEKEIEALRAEKKKLEDYKTAFYQVDSKIEELKDLLLKIKE